MGVLLFAIGTFALGHWTARRGVESRQPTQEGAAIDGVRPRPPADAAAVSETARRIEADPAEEAQMQATRAFTEKTELGRIAAWQEAYERVDAKNWRGIFNLTSKARKAGMISAEEQQRMWQRIGEVAGREAMDAMKPKDLVRDWELNNGRYAMQGWAQRDPAAAWSYIESLPVGNLREGMVAGYAWGQGAVDPERAIAALQILPEDRQAFLARRALENQDGRRMTDLARAWLDTPGDGGSKERQAVFSALLSVQQAVDWDDKPGKKLTSWVESFAGKPYLTAAAVASAANRLARQSPEAALEWTGRIAEKSPAAVGVAAAGVAAHFARADLDATAGWLNAHRESPLYDHATFGFLSAARATINPASAREWIQTIRDPALRGRMEKAFNLPTNPPAR